MDISSKTATTSQDEIEGELDLARRKMQQVYEENRERMRELLNGQQEQQREYQKLKAQSNAFESQAIEATKRGDRASALTLIAQKQSLIPTLEILGKSLETTNQSVEGVTSAITKQREQIEQFAFEAILLKTQLSAAEIQNRIAETLSQMEFGSEFSDFNAGADIVRTLDAENLARNEVFGDRLDYKIAQLDESMSQESAEEELGRLEQRILKGEIPTPKGDFDLDISQLDLSKDSAVGSDQAFLDSLEATIEGLGLDDDQSTDNP